MDTTLYRSLWRATWFAIMITYMLIVALNARGGAQ